MFKIIVLKHSQRQTHIARGVKKGVIPKSTLCGCKFKWTCIKSVVDGNVESCTCQKCVNILNSNLDLFAG